jgi:hypothetical protein
VAEGAAVSDETVYVLTLLALYAALLWGVYEMARYSLGM